MNLKEEYMALKLKLKELKGIKEGKIKKYDDNLLKEMSYYNYFNTPLVLCLLNKQFNSINLRMQSVGLAKILINKGHLNLLRTPKKNYYLLEVTIDDKKYIYDVLTNLVYDYDTYLEVNPDLSLKVDVDNDYILDYIRINDLVVIPNNSSKVRETLVNSTINDYKKGRSWSLKTCKALNDYVDEVVNKEVLHIIKNN